MELFLPSLVVCLSGLALGVVTLSSRRQRDVQRTMRVVAARLGLPLYASRRSARIQGDLGGFEVEIDAAGLGFEDSAEIASVSVRGGGIPRSLTIDVTGTFSVLGRLFDAERVLTHDGPFDAELAVQGDDVQVTALFDVETRRRLLATVRCRGATVFLGRVYLELGRAAASAESAERVLLAVDELLRLARALSIQGPSITERLERNAASDPCAEVRAKNLAVLLREFPSSPAAERTALLALSDPAPWVRFFGAAHLSVGSSLSAQAAGVLAGIALDEAAPEGVRARAVLVLVERHPAEPVVAVLEGLLGSSSAVMAIAATRALAELGRFPAAHEENLRALLGSGDLRALSAVAELVRAPGATTTFEDTWIALLLADPAAARLAIELLGEIGTVRAVGPLRAFSRRLFADPALVESARRAAAAIEGRAGGSGRGRLSLTPVGSEGSLSLGEESRGAVSLAKK